MTASKFNWPTIPTNEVDFEALMNAVDDLLRNEGFQPFQRPLNVPRKFREAFGWEGKVIPSKALEQANGYQGDILMAKAHRWYQQVYGERLKIDWALGMFPAQIGGAIWRVRVPRIYGNVQLFLDRNLANEGVSLGHKGVPASYNILCAVEDLPQGKIDRLSEAALVEYANLYQFAFENFRWRRDLPQTPLFNISRTDLDASTEDFMSRRYVQAHWGAEQAAEKTLKGLLSLARVAFPTSGPNGHNLTHLASLMKIHLDTVISSKLLERASCSAGVRYGKEQSAEMRALQANHAVLGIMDELRNSPAVAKLLATVEGRNK